MANLVFSYPGSKWQTARKICHLYPPCRKFVVPFGGAGGELLGIQKWAEIEVLNDIDHLNYDVFRILQTNPQALINLIERTRFSRSSFLNARKLLEAKDQLTRAYGCIIMGNTGFSQSRQFHRTKGQFTPCLIVRWKGLVNRIKRAAERLKNVHLMNATWQEVFRHHDARDTFFSCDPPYLGMGRDDYYRFKMDDEKEHIAFIDTLLSMKGMAVLFHMPHPLYEEAFKHWTYYEWHGLTSHEVRREGIWLSPNCGGK